MALTPVRVRFAPSPTGPLHMGGVRTALYNYLFARKMSGTFILRIEDTDRTRFVPGAEAYIMESLRWCGIEPDESPEHGGEYGPYRQSERKAMYAQYAEELVKNGHAYYAFDTEDEIASCRQAAEAQKQVWQYDSSTRASMRNSLVLQADEVERLKALGQWTIRFRTPENEEVIFEDAIRGVVRVQSSVVDDKVLMKSDGMPTYHLANIVDDHLMKISHVIRGEEWLPSAALHVMLYRAFGWEAPTFAHLPLILKPEGNGKLSKRDGDKGGFPVFPIEWKDPESGHTASGYRESGYLPDAFINMLLMLGWNPGTEQEQFTRDEMVELFNLERVVKSGARFNPDKARWFNEHVLRNTPVDELLPQLEKLLQDQGLQPASAHENALRQVLDMMLERISFLHDITTALYLFEAPKTYDDKMVKKRWKENSGAVMRDLTTVLGEAESFEPEPLEELFKSFLESRELGMGAVMPLLRILLTGVAGGPSVFAIAAYLGKQETLNRLNTGIEKLG